MFSSSLITKALLVFTLLASTFQHVSSSPNCTAYPRLHPERVGLEDIPHSYELYEEALFALQTSLTDWTPVWFPDPEKPIWFPSKGDKLEKCPGRWEKLNQRWSAAIRPQLDFIVEVRPKMWDERVGEEDVSVDVETCVRWANYWNYSVLAISGGHGQASTLNNVKNGVGIWMHRYNYVIPYNVTREDGSKYFVAIVGGGILVGDLQKNLWDHGYQTVLPGCECIGYMSALLGGGHGWLQGRYGLISDQLIEATVVLPNGAKVITKASDNDDLMWAMRGAGHNFGIVIEARIQIYKRKPEEDNFAVAGYTYTMDKLAKVLEVWNVWAGAEDPPVELTIFGVMHLVPPGMNITAPVFTLWLYWQGSFVPSPYTTALSALNPLKVQKNVTDQLHMDQYLGGNRDGAACRLGLSHVQTSISYPNQWPISRIQDVARVFGDLPRETFNNSVILLEHYATNAVMNETLELQSAYADRENKLMIAPLLTYPPNNSTNSTNSPLDQQANRYINEMRSKAQGNETLPVYVNYARGNEVPGAVYGFDGERQRRLTRLKHLYDPKGVMDYYMPIPYQMDQWGCSTDPTLGEPVE